MYYPIMIKIDFGYLLQWNILYLNQSSLPEKSLRFLPLLIRPLGLIKQAFKLGISNTFVNTGACKYLQF